MGEEKLAYHRRAQSDRATDWPGPPAVSRRRRWRLESPWPPLHLRHLHRPRHLRPMRSSPSPCQSPENEHQRFVRTVNFVPPPYGSFPHRVDARDRRITGMGNRAEEGEHFCRGNWWHLVTMARKFWRETNDRFLLLKLNFLSKRLLLGFLCKFPCSLDIRRWTYVIEIRFTYRRLE